MIMQNLQNQLRKMKTSLKGFVFEGMGDVVIMTDTMIPVHGKCSRAVSALKAGAIIVTEEFDGTVNAIQAVKTVSLRKTE